MRSAEVGNRRGLATGLPSTRRLGGQMSIVTANGLARSVNLPGFALGSLLRALAIGVALDLIRAIESLGDALGLQGQAR